MKFLLFNSMFMLMNAGKNKNLIYCELTLILIQLYKYNYIIKLDCFL